MSADAIADKKCPTSGCYRLLVSKLEPIAWCLLVGLSAALSWTVAHLAPPLAASEPPPPLSRPITAPERAALELEESRLSALLVEAEGRLGRALRLDELEGAGPSGRPWLPGGVPDNPTVPGHAHVVESCEQSPAERGADWAYCPSPVRLRAILP